MADRPNVFLSVISPRSAPQKQLCKGFRMTYLLRSVRFNGGAMLVLVPVDLLVAFNTFHRDISLQRLHTLGVRDMPMILSCIFPSSPLAKSMNHMHWTLSRGVLVISRCGLQKIVWNAMAWNRIVWDHKQKIAGTMRHQPCRHRFGYCHAIR